MQRVFALLGLVCGLGCAATRMPTSRPVADTRDRLVALRTTRNGPLMGQFGDGTVGLFRSWSNGTLTLRVRSTERAKSIIGGCYLRDDGEARCLGDEGQESKLYIGAPDAEEIAFALNGELCVRTRDGIVHCNRPFGVQAEATEKLFASLGRASKLIDGTNCLIDAQHRLRCLAEVRTDKGYTYEPTTLLEDITEAQLVPNGPYAVTGCARTTRGTLMCTGSNRLGEQGVGKRSWHEAWHEVAGLPKVRSFAHHLGLTCAIEDDGASDGSGPVWCFGHGFGPDFGREAAKIPDCPSHVKKVVVPRCPPSGANGDNPCLRAGGSNSDRVVDEIVYETDAQDQCPKHQGERYVPTPTRLTLIARARQLETYLEGARFLRDDGVVVSTFYEKFTDTTPPSVPNDLR